METTTKITAIEISGILGKLDFIRAMVEIDRKILGLYNSSDDHVLTVLDEITTAVKQIQDETRARERIEEANND